MEDQDRAPFAALNADAIVMEFYPAMLSRTESDTFVDRIEDHSGFGPEAARSAITDGFDRLAINKIVPLPPRSMPNHDA